MGLWSRSSSSIVDVFGYGPEGNFVAFHNHSDDRNGNNDTRWDNGFAILIYFYISVMMEGDNQAMWSRSSADSYWCRVGKYSNDRYGNQSAGFANPRDALPPPLLRLSP